MHFAYFFDFGASGTQRNATERKWDPKKRGAEQGLAAFREKERIFAILDENQLCSENQ